MSQRRADRTMAKPAARSVTPAGNQDDDASPESESPWGESSVAMASVILRQTPAFLAMLVIAAIYTVIARDSGLGAVILVPVVVVTLILLRVMATWRGHHRLARQLAIVLLGAITVAEVVVTSLIVGDILDTSTRLIDVSPHEAQMFLRDAMLVWFMNILTFSIWYWELDGDGPTDRHLNGYRLTDLLFPQFTIPPRPHSGPTWVPHWVDYLFLAFTTSTAFGPADTPVLSVRLKVLTIVQATISMAVLVVVVAWALSVL